MSFEIFTQYKAFISGERYERSWWKRAERDRRGLVKAHFFLSLPVDGPQTLSHSAQGHSGRGVTWRELPIMNTKTLFRQRPPVHVCLIVVKRDERTTSIRLYHWHNRHGRRAIIEDISYTSYTSVLVDNTADRTFLMGGSSLTLTSCRYLMAEYKKYGLFHSM